MRAALGLGRILVVTVLTVTACTADPAAVPPPPGTRVASALVRSTAAAPAADVAAVVTSNGQFGLDLLHALVPAAPRDNLVFSPYSVSAALAMAYAGAAGTTHDAFDRTLHLTVAEPAFHRAMNDLDRQLTSRGQGAAGTGGQPFRLDVTNQLFTSLQATFLPSYLDLLAQEYGASGQLLDFAGAPDPSRLAINRWVELKTAGHIKDLLPPGIVKRDTRGVLVNAIYFNAAWAKKFDTTRTSAAPFHLLDGTSVSTQMMRDPGLSALAATVDGVEVVSLPYDGHELSLLILMPPAGSFADWERSLSMSDIARFAAARAPERLALSMPRFTIRTSAALTTPLAGMGLAVAFSDGANFSRMSATEPLLISDVVHQAVIIVDEGGTVAAAATGVIIGPTSAAPVTPRTVVIDRPFLYAIRDEATGAILFLGRHVKPEA